jgi:hypothetical protein
MFGTSLLMETGHYKTYKDIDFLHMTSHHRFPVDVEKNDSSSRSEQYHGGVPDRRRRFLRVWSYLVISKRFDLPPFHRLFGVVSIQTFYYFQNYSSDHLLMKAFVRFNFPYNKYPANRWLSKVIFLLCVALNLAIAQHWCVFNRSGYLKLCIPRSIPTLSITILF